MLTNSNNASGTKIAFNITSGFFTYKVDFNSFKKIKCIQVHLLWLRLLRNIHRIVHYVMSLAFVSVLWIAYLIMLFFVYKSNNVAQNFNTIILDNATSIFTSIVIVGCISILNGQQNYKRIIKNQFDLYKDLSYQAGFLLTSLYSKIYDKKCVYNDPTFCFSTLNEFESNLDDSIPIINSKKIYSQNIIIQKNKIIDNLTLLLSYVYKDEITYWKRYYPEIIFSAKKIKELLEINQFSTKDEQTNYLLDLSNEFFELIDYIRKPWRRDLKEDNKIRKILKSNGIDLPYCDETLLND